MVVETPFNQFFSNKFKSLPTFLSHCIFCFGKHITEVKWFENLTLKCNSEYLLYSLTCMHCVLLMKRAVGFTQPKLKSFIQRIITLVVVGIVKLNVR